MRALVAAVIVAGCGFKPASSTSDLDAAIDGPGLLIDTPAGCTSYSTQFDSCVVGSGSNADLSLTGNTKYNTDTNTLTLDNLSTIHPPHVVINTVTGSVDVLFVGSFSLTGTLRVSGTFPFGIAATGSVTIAGILDASNNGAGARSDTDCKTALTLGIGGESTSGGGAGGGGGGFHGVGGGGGPGNKDGTNTTGGAGGGSTIRPAGLLGGCDGGKGGDGVSSNAGNAGDGGGAVLIATQSQVTVAGSGAIDVGGGGGHNGNVNGGAGGGGASGGMILIECLSLRYAGAIVANGGGGGEGADSGNAGMTGANGTRTSSRALGGFGSAGEGGDAADGGAGATNDGLAATQLKNGGGGGGGGGTGYIAIKCGSIMDSGGTISPAYAAWP